MGLAVPTTVGTGMLVGTPLHAAAAETLTLSASATSANAGQSVTLTATASPTPAASYQIVIEDQTAGRNLDGCVNNNPCGTSVSYPTAGSHTYEALLNDWQTGTLLATSNTVTVTWTWTGTATYTLSLSASTTQPDSGQTAVVTATVSPNTPTGYRIDLPPISRPLSPAISAAVRRATPCRAPTRSSTWTFSASPSSSM